MEMQYVFLLVLFSKSRLGVKIYAKSITECVEILPNMLYYNGIEFDYIFIDNLEV